MRNPSVSIAKGIAIILMVIGHSGCYTWLRNYIYMFHMPLFFFMSGYCFKETYLTDAKSFVIKKIKGIWWPFVQWELIFLLLHNVFYSINIYNNEYGFNGNVSHLYGFTETIKYVFKTIIMFHGEQLLGGFWFLRSLFIGIMLFYFLKFFSKKVTKSDFITDTIVVFSLLLGSLTLGWLNKISTKDIVAGLFIWIGYMYNKHNLNFEKQFFYIIASVIFIAIASVYWCCDMLNLSFYLIIPYVITGVIGTLMVLGLSKHIVQCNKILKKILVFVGDNTLTILIWHFLSFKIINQIIILSNNISIKRLAEYPVIEEFAHKGWWTVYSIAGLCIPLCFCILKKK